MPTSSRRTSWHDNPEHAGKTFDAYKVEILTVGGEFLYSEDLPDEGEAKALAKVFSATLETYVSVAVIGLELPTTH